MAANLRIEEFTVGPVMTNCYFLVNVDTSETIIVDPGAAAARLIEILTERGYKPVAVFLTHGHYDHATCAEEMAKHYDVPIYALEDEKETLEDPKYNLSGSWTGKSLYFYADCYLKDGEEFDLAGFHIKALLVPGHTRGGCCYYLADQKTLVSGDTLFRGSVGRSDFPGGDAKALLKTIREKLFVLPGDTQVLPGHDRRTTIGYEKQYNMFF